MTKKYSRILSKIALVLLIFSFNLYGQESVNLSDLKRAKPAFSKVLTLKHESKLLKREAPYRVILPNVYNTDKNKRFAVLYLLHGLSGNYKSWSEKTKLQDYSGNYELIIVMPDAKNSWYSDSAVAQNDKFETYIVEELIPQIDKDFRTKANRKGRIIAGLSMGGYGSLKFGLKHPDKFVLAGSFSGALRAAEWSKKDFPTWKVLADSVDQTFGNLNSKTRVENNIFKILESKTRDELGKLPFIYLDCGTEDGLINQNQDFVNLLQSQKVPHEFRQLPGRHDWKFWDSQIQEFLELAEKFIDE